MAGPTSKFVEWFERPHVAGSSSGGRESGVGLDQEHRRKLIEGITYSRGFVVSFQLVLLAFLLVFTIWHWTVKFQRARRAVRRVDENGKDGMGRISENEGTVVSSASSSTLTATVTPPDAAKGQLRDPEVTPLLSGQSVPRQNLLALCANRARAALMYQPPNLPIVNKTLPSNATSVLVIAFLGLNAFYVFYRVPLDLDLIFIFADRTGLMFVANLPLLYLLAAKNQPLKSLTGYSYENLNILHRRLGELMCLLALLHSIGMSLVWYEVLRPLGMSLGTYLTERIILLGLGALAAYETLYLTSLGSFRQWWYEVFLGTHVVLQAVALVLVFFHHHGARLYVGVALGIFLVDRIVFRICLKTMTVRADLTVLEDGETVMVSADWPLACRWFSISRIRLVRRLFDVLDCTTDTGWKPTEHIFLSVPSLATKHIIQAHPFTIASAAPEGEQSHAWFNLIIRAHDGFSRDLLRYADRHASVSVKLDGPYGSLHVLEMMQASDVAVVIAGGSGIAVAFPLIWSLLHHHHTHAEGRNNRQQICLIWVIHDASHVSWIGQERFDELREMGLHLMLPLPTSKAGRPDIGVLLQDMIDDVTTRKEDACRIGVLVSGPDGMNRNARNTCASLVSQGRDVSVAVEKYGW